jgi:LacI family transcriptional regulator
MTRLLAASERPTAVLVASMNAAVGALSSAVGHGVRVPEELSLVTIHDTWIAHYTNPSITTVAMPMHAAGRAAAAMLLDHLTGEPLLDRVINEPLPELIARASTAALR